MTGFGSKLVRAQEHFDTGISRGGREKKIKSSVDKFNKRRGRKIKACAGDWKWLEVDTGPKSWLSGISFIMGLMTTVIAR